MILDQGVFSKEVIKVIRRSKRRPSVAQDLDINRWSKESTESEIGCKLIS